MAKREAQARSVSPGEKMPATLSSAAEVHAQALRRQLLESTELAAKEIVGQTRAEGERRIEVARRRAQAIAETVAQIEQAEQVLADRAKVFADASKSLRAELESFATVLSGGEERLAPEAPDEPELGLVASPAPEKSRPGPPPSGIGQILFAAEVDEAVEEDIDGGEDDNRPEEDFGDEDDEEEDEPDEDDEPPTPEEIARFFRETEEAELARADRLAEGSKREGLRGRMRRFFNGPDEVEASEDTPSAREPEKSAKPASRSGRERLYTAIVGAVIGLGGAAALINFVLLD